MKIFGQILLCIGISSAFSLKAQIMTNNPHQTHFIETSIGRIACYIQHVPHTIPIIFLHGVYYDHNLWQSYASKITDRTVILIDMPLHGMSREIIKGEWDMDDCVNMLKEILDNLDIGKCYAIGHSWGSMTILRAATAFPERFKSIGLCNMPLESGSKGKKLKFFFQHLILGMKKFYVKQVSKAMFLEENMQKNPHLIEYLQSSFNILSTSDIRHIDKAVITHVNSGYPYLNAMSVPAIALKGDQDYVPTLEKIPTRIVRGKHTSPLENPNEVLSFIQDVIQLNEDQ